MTLVYEHNITVRVIPVLRPMSLSLSQMIWNISNKIHLLFNGQFMELIKTSEHNVRIQPAIICLLRSDNFTVLTLIPWLGLVKSAVLHIDRLPGFPSYKLSCNQRLESNTGFGSGQLLESKGLTNWEIRRISLSHLPWFGARYFNFSHLSISWQLHILRMKDLWIALRV